MGKGRKKGEDGPPWTEERVDRLRGLVADGLSAKLISRRFGDISRNAVLGKMHRLGLCQERVVTQTVVRAQPSPALAPPKKRRPRPRVAVQSEPKSKPPPPSLSEPVATATKAGVWPGARMISLLALNSTTCRFPHGDPGEPGFAFCGADIMGGSVYCQIHHRLCYDPRSTS